MRKLLVLSAAVAAAVAAGTAGDIGAGVSPTAAIGARGAYAEAASCRTVVKRVRGKRRQVRVCTKARPRNVALKLDAGRAVGATIGTGGGTVRAEAAGGAVLTLTVPAGALPEETLITLTPVSALSGLSGIRLRAGAELSPEGLALAKPATLSIRVANGAAARALAWWERGEDVSRRPVTRAGGEIRIAVTHFSGAGVGTGSAAAWSGVPDPAVALRARFAADVRPLLARAPNEDPLTSSTFAVALGWEREVALLGLTDQFEGEIAQIRRALEASVANAIGRAETSCKGSHDLMQVERLTRLDRVAQLFGLRVPGDSAFARAVECARFSVDIDFHVAFHLVSAGPVTQSGDLSVRATDVVLEPGPALRPQGARALEVVSWQLTHSLDLSPVMSCTGGPAGTRPVSDVQAALELDLSAWQAGGRPGVSLRIDPGDVETLAQVTCNPGGSTTEPILNWAELWKHVFADRLGPDGRLLVQVVPPLGSWVGGDVLATYGPETRTAEFGAASFNYATTATWNLVLRHTPAA